MTDPLFPAQLIDDVRDRVRFGVPIRPPYLARTDLHFDCARVESVDGESLTHLDGRVNIVRCGAFLGVVADDAATARRAATDLKVRWANSPSGVDRTQHQLTDTTRQNGTYSYAWPNRSAHGAWHYVVADYSEKAIRVWGAIRTPQALARDIAALCACAAGSVEIFTDAVGTAIRGIADDAAADAVLMSRAVAAPIAVMPDPDGEHAPDMLGDAPRVTWQAEVSAPRMNEVSESWTQSASSVPVLARLLASVGVGGNANAALNAEIRPAQATGPGPYQFESYHRSAVGAPVDAGWQAPASAALLSLFARESFMDEMAHSVQADPVAWRLEHLADERHRRLLNAVARAAEWDTPKPKQRSDERLRGQGVACELEADQSQASRSVWIVDLEVDRVTGTVELTRLLIGEDQGPVRNNAALRSRLQHLLLGPDSGFFTSAGTTTNDWERNTTALPMIESVSLPSVAGSPARDSEIAYARPEHVAPGVAAVANALFDATGIRLREPPFDAPRMREVMADRKLLKHDVRNRSRQKRRWRSARWALLGIATLVGAATALFGPLRGAIPKRNAEALSGLYSNSAIARGRKVAAAGDCSVCHTADGGATNAGGLAFHTPFGVVYSTNITPDPATGIGEWSYAAFERAMRRGISRDGHHLYPVFPYTAFAKINDTDMHALYAYLMTRSPVGQSVPTNRLKFPFSYRPLMAGWNALFLSTAAFEPDPARNALYNRGKYLSEGLGHCAACHSPRNLLGAEKTGINHFAGGSVDGWDAPALNSFSAAPIAWSEQDLYDYLRTGRSTRHGPAAGPMQPVIHELNQLSDHDIRAIAHYIATYFKPQKTKLQDRDLAANTPATVSGDAEGETLFARACASCHENAAVPRFDAAETDLVLNTNLHAEKPDNLLQVIVNGIDAGKEHGAMPAFGDSLTNHQIEALARYMRARYAPNTPAWENLSTRLNEVRKTPGS